MNIRSLLSMSVMSRLSSHTSHRCFHGAHRLVAEDVYSLVRAVYSYHVLDACQSLQLLAHLLLLHQEVLTVLLSTEETLDREEDQFMHVIQRLELEVDSSSQYRRDGDHLILEDLLFVCGVAAVIDLVTHRYPHPHVLWLFVFVVAVDVDEHQSLVPCDGVYLVVKGLDQRRLQWTL